MMKASVFTPFLSSLFGVMPHFLIPDLSNGEIRFRSNGGSVPAAPKGAVARNRRLAAKRRAVTRAKRLGQVKHG